MMELDWQAIGTAVGGAVMGISAAIGVAWGSIQKAKKDVANTKADVAQSTADQKVADAQGTVYKMLNDSVQQLTQRVNQQDLSIQQLHTQLIARDQRIASLENHIFNLETTMRAHGIEPPRLVTIPSAVPTPAPTSS